QISLCRRQLLPPSPFVDHRLNLHCQPLDVAAFRSRPDRRRYKGFPISECSSAWHTFWPGLSSVSLFQGRRRRVVEAGEWRCQGQGMRIFKVPVEGGSPVQLVDTLSYQPLWSPDSRFIVYAEAGPGGTNHVRAVTPDKTPVPLPDISVNYTFPNPYRFVPNRK